MFKSKYSYFVQKDSLFWYLLWLLFFSQKPRCCVTSAMFLNHSQLFLEWKYHMLYPVCCYIQYATLALLFVSKAQMGSSNDEQST